MSGRGWLLGLVAAVALALPQAQAQRLEIDTHGDPNARLEIRQVTLPDGREVELYVVRADPVTVRTESRVIEANHIEFDPEAREIRVVGRGRIEFEGETFFGSDLRVRLDEERADGDDVVIVTDAVDVTGEAAQRAPGRVRVQSGAFSPCARCGQTVNDYGFRAQRIELLPGDRLIAFDVTVLIRGEAAFGLPLLVLPLAEPPRRPRFTVRRAGSGNRAMIGLDWPYVAGPNALGSVSLRTWADVAPGEGNAFTGPLLGGRPETWYLGGEIDHRFYDAVGSGRFRVAYRPRFLDANAEGGRTRDEVELEVRYATDAGDANPRLDLALLRDDAARDRVVEARADVESVEAGVRGRLRSDLSIPLEAEARTDLGGRSPVQTPLRLELSPEDLSDWTVGPVSVDELLVDLGAFEDRSNPGNRSAATARTVSALRVLERHRLTLSPTSPWPGMTLSGETDFRGQYYDTGERLVDWDSRLEARQEAGDVAEFGVRYRRDVAEGETPFRFDRVTLRTRTDVVADVRLTPTPWLTFTSEGGYLLTDSRSPGDEGWLPIASELTLFGDRTWIDLSLSNAYDVQEDDPGELEGRLLVRTTGASVDARAEVTARRDLAVRPDRTGNEARDTSEVDVDVAAGLPPWVSVDARGGYQFDPPSEEGEPDAPWRTLEVGATIGTLRTDDFVPGLRVAWERDPNEGRTTAFSYELVAGTDPLTVEVEQRYDLPDGGAGDHAYRLAWEGIARAELEGPALLGPQVWGLPAGAPEPVAWTARLADDPSSGSGRWSVSWHATRDPDLDGAAGWRDSRLEADATLERVGVAGARFSVDGFMELPLADDQQQLSYLRRANVTLGVDLFGRVGVQGTIGYRGRLDAAGTGIESARLAFDAFTVTVRPLDDLYLGARLDDVWELAADDPAAPAFDIRPEVFFALDRCCWALYGTWNTEDGEVTLTLGAPGAAEGLQSVFDSGLTLPEPETDASASATEGIP